jgi:hypothetical protein
VEQRGVWRGLVEEERGWKMEEGADSYFCWTSRFLVAERAGYRDMESLTFDAERLFWPRLDLIRGRVFTLHLFISLECITLDYSIAKPASCFSKL